MPNFKATKKLRQNQSRAFAVCLYAIQNGTAPGGKRLTESQLVQKKEQLEDLQRAFVANKRKLPNANVTVKAEHIYKSLRKISSGEVSLTESAE